MLRGRSSRVRKAEAAFPCALDKQAKSEPARRGLCAFYAAGSVWQEIRPPRFSDPRGGMIDILYKIYILIFIPRPPRGAGAGLPFRTAAAGRFALRISYTLNQAVSNGQSQGGGTARVRDGETRPGLARRRRHHAGRCASAGFAGQARIRRPPRGAATLREPPKTAQNPAAERRRSPAAPRRAPKSRAARKNCRRPVDSSPGQMV